MSKYLFFLIRNTPSSSAYSEPIDFAHTDPHAEPHGHRGINSSGDSRHCPVAALARYLDFRSTVSTVRKSWRTLDSRCRCCFDVSSGVLSSSCPTSAARLRISWFIACKSLLLLKTAFTFGYVRCHMRHTKKLPKSVHGPVSIYDIRIDGPQGLGQKCRSFFVCKLVKCMIIEWIIMKDGKYPGSLKLRLIEIMIWLS